jgi:hypothetical protein
MQIEVDYRYLDAQIEWGKKVEECWKEGEREHIVRCLTHELCHIITGESKNPFATSDTAERIKPLAEHFDERITETVSRIAYRLYWRWLRENKPTGWKSNHFLP